ncbi:MAG: hercynine metabolism protein [Synechococcaceae cyanobacterium]|nr:hercynine metabolism protein [Synechococcaceae cyanobacterium]
MSSSWLEELEARLEQQLEGFLRSNPRQEELLAEQESQDRQRQLRQRRLQLQARAETSRRQLLELAEEIRRWQGRVGKARQAGADDLAARAEAHIASLMERGRQAWQQLGELGQEFAAVEADLEALGRSSGNPACRDGGAPGTQPPAGAAGAAASGSPGGATSGGSPAGASATGGSAGKAGSAAGSTPAGSAATPRSAVSAGAGEAAADLDASWADFEARLELEALRQRLGS